MGNWKSTHGLEYKQRTTKDRQKIGLTLNARSFPYMNNSMKASVLVGNKKVNHLRKKPYRNEYLPENWGTP